MYLSFEEKDQYFRLMECIKSNNTEFKQICEGKIYRAGKAISILFGIRNLQGRKAAIKYFRNWREQKRLRRRFPDGVHKYEQRNTPNYFSEERVAIYTCIIGKYDHLEEPGFVPDNCDYYIVTDQDVDSNSKWKRISLEPFKEKLTGFSNAEINRFFKMKPDILFPQYKYSIYLDGNIKPVSDLTEFVNLIGVCGIAAHKHSIRDDVYREAEVLRFLKRDTAERIDGHVNFLRETGMPEHYGLIECNVIAREHHNTICKKIMKEWWDEFLSYSKRDQISFVHVLFLNNISPDEVGTLGDNVYENPAIRKVGHR